MTAGSGELTVHLERVLPAPRPLVFGMHTEPDQLAALVGSSGFYRSQHRPRRAGRRRVSDRDAAT